MTTSRKPREARTDVERALDRAAAARPDADIMADYAGEDEFARINGISKRTVERYRAQPDGLPYLEFGGRIHIPIEESREWLRARIKRPNQRRRAD
jgi:hypothetical protein